MDKCSTKQQKTQISYFEQNKNKLEFNNNKRYFLLYVKANVLKEVTVKTFKKLEGKVISFRNGVVRVIGNPPVSLSFSEIKRRFSAQGLYEEFSDILDGIKTILGALKGVGKASTLLTKRNMMMIAKLLLELESVLSSSEFHLSSYISLIISVFMIKEEFVAQGLSNLVAGVCVDFLPPEISGLIKKLLTLTTAKILDDSSLIYTIFKTFILLFEKILDAAGFANTEIGKNFACFLNSVKLSSSHFLIAEMEKIIALYDKDNKIVTKPSFLLQVKVVNEKLKNNLSVIEWGRRSAGINAIIQTWTRLGKVIESYSSSSRKEPSCFIFEGPPGVFKSVLMNNLIELRNETNYTYAPKAVGDGKDFFDIYQNEENFIIDDMGQNGVSQWRLLMNLVAPVKFPLDCATAELKNTKFFNSERIFITTNNFSNLQNGLTKTDCISDIVALYRRGYIFDFSQVKRDGCHLSGFLSFKHFNLKESRFVTGFPSEFRELDSLGHTFKIDTYDKNKILVWMNTIVSFISSKKKDQKQNNDLTDVDQRLINAQVEQHLSRLRAQGELNSEKKENSSLFSSSTFSSSSSSGSYWISDIQQELDEDKDLWEFSNTLVLSTVVKAPWYKQLFSSFISDVFKNILATIVSGYNNHGEIVHAILVLICAATIQVTVDFLVAKGIAFFKNKKWGKSQAQIDLEAQALFSKDEINVHNSIIRLGKNIFNITLLHENKTFDTRALVSGRAVLIPAHLATQDQFDIVIYSSKEKNARLVDGDIVSKVYINHNEDIAIYKFRDSFPSPFTSILPHIKINASTNHKYSFLISDYGWAPVGSINIRPFLDNLVYSFPATGYTNKTGIAVAYDYQAPGFCGSIVANQDSGIIGMHVAGDGQNNIGVAIVWSDSVKIEIINHISPLSKCVPFVPRLQEIPNQSVIRLEGSYNTYVPAGTNFGESPLFGIYPVEREPANLSKFGKFTIKDVAKKSFTSCSLQDTRSMDFADKVIKSVIMKPFVNLPDLEVIKGNSLLAPLNKDSSNGYNCDKEKEVYINFEKGEVTPRFSEELRAFEKSINEDNPDWEKLFWVESLKDEIRDKRKEGVPRSFRVGTIHQQFLMKRIFGNFVSNVIATRSMHEIMIGCNPIKEWPLMYEKLVSSQGVFAGDIKGWDGNMLGQVQRRVTDLMKEAYEGPDRKVMETLLETLVHSFVIVKDDLYLTTHSMPSGSFLTAIFNSIVNKYYTAMWYFDCLDRVAPMRFPKDKPITPTVMGFWSDVVDFVYGDDKLNAINAHTHVLNAITMRDFFQQLGMDLTDSMKKPIQTPFQKLSEVTFLKRSFVYHNYLGKIVCPLDLMTLQSGLSYVDYTKVVPQVMGDKISTYQREIYLHPNREELLDDFSTRMKERSYPFKRLDYFYLFYLYSNEEVSLPNYISTYA
jgi:hypothetical protein